ncbi:MAG: EamA family transporter [Microgenomates group bacterium]
MSYITYAWIATAIYGFETVVTKLTGKYAIKNPWLFNMLWNGLFVVFMIPFYFNSEVGIPHKWTSLIITALLSAVCCVLYVISIYRIDVSVLSPMYNVRTGFSVLFGVLLLGETLTPYKTILIGIIILMGLLVSFDETFSFKAFLTKNIVVALAFMVLLALYGVFLKKTIGEIGYWNATVWVAGLTAFFLLFTFPKFKNDIKTLRRKQFLPVIFITFTSVIAYLVSNKAYEVNVGITTVIMSIPSSMIIAFIMSRIWPTLMEKHPLRVYAVRFFAAAIMFGCAIQLG